MHSHIYFADTLSDQQALIDSLVATHSLPPLTAFVDGRHLACPLPLLKAKLALRHLKSNEHLYLVATDKNSVTDLTAFCQKNSLTSQHWQSDDSTTSDTIFHFIITKNTSV
ncbi:MAG: sulfurtransferase TusA family protein [Moraxella sp.]|nr:sulfurtransferase TusA family protein [Moraxella sp.]